MKTSIEAAAVAVMMTITTMSTAQNILIQPFDGVRQTPRFSAITDDMWSPAIDTALTIARADVDAITANAETPTFYNTIVALENSGAELNQVLGLFYALLEANSNDTLMELAVTVSQKLSDYSTSLVLNRPLWERVKTVYENRGALNLCAEDSMLLQNTYDSFDRSGARLEGEERELYRKLSGELSELTTKFGQNVLRELHTYKIYLSSADLGGLPQSMVTAAAEGATAEGHNGEYLVTLDQPVYMAFLKNSDRRDLRERMYRLYNGRNTSGEYSNMDNICRIADLRRRIAKLLGADTYAEHALKHTMAKTPEAVYDLLGRLKEAYKPAMQAEMRELTDFASELEGKPVTIMPWDYSYYSNKLKAAKYSFDEEKLRPYFELNNVIDGVFGLATRLYGLTFTYNPKIEVYHPDVKAYEVKDEDGTYLGVLYTDFFPRSSKRPGAWMTNFKEQYVTADGQNSRPLVNIVMNFTKPTSETPSLLTPYEVETFLHEFGHSLHGLLANSHYSSLSGTNVYRDFVELPSQFNENFLTEREFLDSFAKHYQTGEPIPQEYVDALLRSSRYGAAYSCMRQLGFGYLDMAWHTIDKQVDDPVAFENSAMSDVAVFAPVEGAMTSPQFNHIFSGGYAAGYYSYKWAEVLDADAFAYLKTHGIFDRTTAESFRRNVLMKGGTEDPSELYRRFRGCDPEIDALLIRDGIKQEPKPNVAMPPVD